MPKFRIPGISLTPASPSDDITVHSISRGSSTTVIQHPTSGLIMHSVGGLPLIMRQYAVPRKHNSVRLIQRKRKLIAETRIGEMTVAIDLETSFQELYRDLQKRAARRAIFHGRDLANVMRIQADEVVGCMQLDLSGQMYPIVEQNWEREVRGLCSLTGARFRFDFHVVRVAETERKGSGGNVKNMIVAAGCGLVGVMQRVVMSIAEALKMG